MPTPPFTVRQLMIAVAIVGLLVAAGRWIVEMRARSALYNRRAIDFANCTVNLFSAGSKAFIRRRTVRHAKRHRVQIAQQCVGLQDGREVPATLLLPLVAGRAGPPSPRSRR